MYLLRIFFQKVSINISSNLEIFSILINEIIDAQYENIQKNNNGGGF
jgi:hypothetical protein